MLYPGGETSWIRLCTYLSLRWHDRDNLLEDIDEPLWVQYNHILQIAVGLTAKVDDRAKIVVELQHREQLVLVADAEPLRQFSYLVKKESFVKSII